jgi:plasmid stabilization system protein ParE
MGPSFHAGACLDLGAFDPSLPDCGVAAHVARAHETLAWVVLMEDRQPVFFHGYAGYHPEAGVPLNRHGPRADAWRQSDVKRLVQAFHTHGVKVLLGYWAHECSFVDERHPELLIRDAEGKLWQDFTEMNADFSPLRRMKADPDHDVREGERYATWSGRRYARLSRDLGFDGLFLGDGAMGFRRHGQDWKDLRHFDYHEDWLAEFRADVSFSVHAGCALQPGANGPEAARDVQTHHWEHWVAFNTERWTDFYRTMATAVHATGGILAAYNVMNYDPALARLHGVDYRGIAEAGLDILVFQAYDYAWGPLGPFGFLHIAKKDLETNLQTLLRTRAHVGFDTPMRIIVTVETEDEVETWNAPVPHTLGELYHYGNALAEDEGKWRRAADGAFIVWGNSVAEAEWRALATAFNALSAPPGAPRSALLWSPSEIDGIIARGVPTEQEPAALYAHVDDPHGVSAILKPGSQAAAAAPTKVRSRAPR